MEHPHLDLIAENMQSVEHRPPPRPVSENIHRTSEKEKRKVIVNYLENVMPPNVKGLPWHML